MSKGEKKHTFPRLNLRQVLDNDSEHKCNFYAVILDPDTKKRVKSVLVFTAEPGELVEFGLEREPLFAGHEDYYESRDHIG